MTYLEITLPCPAARSSRVRKERGGARYFDLRGEHWYSAPDLRRETHLREPGLSPSHAHGPLQGLCSTHLMFFPLCLRNAAVRMQSVQLREHIFSKNELTLGAVCWEVDNRSPHWCDIPATGMHTSPRMLHS